jgi:hypothetical protein
MIAFEMYLLNTFGFILQSLAKSPEEKQNVAHVIEPLLQAKELEMRRLGPPSLRLVRDGEE